jgi:hypothetical protein
VRVDEAGHFAADVERDALSLKSDTARCTLTLDGQTLSPADLADGARGVVVTASAGDVPDATAPTASLPRLASSDVPAALDRATRAVLDPDLSVPARAWLRSRIAVVAAAHGLPDPLASLIRADAPYDATEDELIGLLDRGPDADTDGE